MANFNTLINLTDTMLIKLCDHVAYIQLYPMKVILYILSVMPFLYLLCSITTSKNDLFLLSYR